MGDYQLWLGDCLEKMRDIPDGVVDMVFADLPYGVTANKWDSVIPFEPLWEQLLRVGKKNCAFVFTATQPFTTSFINSMPSLFRYDLVWIKQQGTGFQNANCRPMAAHESVLVFSRATANSMSKLRITYNPQKVQGKPFKKGPCSLAHLNYNSKLSRVSLENKDGMRHPSSVIYVVSPRVKGQHPTQKPLALLEWLIKTYSNEGDLILDPTAGSGTTGVACINTGRKFIGIEKDADYYQLASNRLAAASTRGT